MNNIIYAGNSLGKRFYRYYKIANNLRHIPFLGGVFSILYRAWTHLHGIHIPLQTQIGKDFVIWHGEGIVINGGTKIGDRVTMRPNTVLGSAKHGGGCPTILDGVDIGTNCVIIGEVTVGKEAVVGAGSVVVKDVPDYAVVVGNPAHVVNYRKPSLL